MDSIEKLHKEIIQEVEENGKINEIDNLKNEIENLKKQLLGNNDNGTIENDNDNENIENIENESEE